MLSHPRASRQLHSDPILCDFYASSQTYFCAHTHVHLFFQTHDRTMETVSNGILVRTQLRVINTAQFPTGQIHQHLWNFLFLDIFVWLIFTHSKKQLCACLWYNYGLRATSWKWNARSKRLWASLRLYDVVLEESVTWQTALGRPGPSAALSTREAASRAPSTRLPRLGGLWSLGSWGIARNSNILLAPRGTLQ